MKTLLKTFLAVSIAVVAQGQDKRLFVTNATDKTITIRPVTGSGYASESDQTLAPGQTKLWYGNFLNSSFNIEANKSWQGNKAWMKRNATRYLVTINPSIAPDNRITLRWNVLKNMPQLEMVTGHDFDKDIDTTVTLDFIAINVPF
jgi:hypothetical protein